jgi:hypothetical protein
MTNADGMDGLATMPRMPRVCHYVGMGRQRRREQQARLLEFHTSLPPTQRGMVMAALWGYAMVFVAAECAVIVALIRGLRRGWQRREQGAGTAARAAASSSLWATLAAAVVPWVLRKWLTGAVENGRARAWLERGDRWLAGRDGRGQHS